MQKIYRKKDLHINTKKAKNYFVDAGLKPICKKINYGLTGL